jgi:hypothetical protein
MKKIIAFVSSLLLVLPSFGQNSNTKDNTKPQGVSKVKQENVKEIPVTNTAKPVNAELKNSGKMKNTSNAKTVKLAGSGSAQKNSGNGK